MRHLACLLATALASVSVSSLHAQESDARGTVSGRVVEAGTGVPVAGAEVRLGAERVVGADADGGWRIGKLPAGTYTLHVRRIGYVPRSLSVTLTGRDPTTMTIALQPAALGLGEMVVTASRREQRLADVAVPTELVSREAIDATGASDLASVLTEQTGIQFEGGHPSGSGVMLQGLSSERVLVLLDGQPLYGRISGNFDVARIPTSIVERVEVVKGPQSALYGSEAMGGVINIVTRAPTSHAWNGEARMLTGTDGRMEAGASANAAIGDLAATVDVGRRAIDRAPGQRAAAGTLAERMDVGARLAWRREADFSLDGAVLVLDERQRWPSGTLYDFADNTQVTARAGAVWRTGAGIVRPTVHISHFDHLARRSQFSQPIAGTGDRQTQRLIEAEVLYNGTAFGEALDAGIEVKQERITSTDGRIDGGTRTLGSVEPFAQLDLSTERWSVVPGVRVSWNERWGSVVTPRLALRYRLTDGFSLRAVAGRGFRAPDFKELYLRFTNDAAGYAVYGNTELEPESSTNVGAGLEWTGGRLFARAQAFWNDLHDFIETRPVPTSGSLVHYSYANVSRARTYGAELESGLVLAPVRIEAAYSYLGTEDRATGKPLLGRPTHSGRLSLGHGEGDGLRVALTGLYTGRTPMQRDETGTITSTREAFLRFDARIAHPLPYGLELSVGADNLFDAAPDQWADAVGRLWYVGLSWNTERTSIR